MSTKYFAGILTVLLFLGLAAPSFGCPVCFGATDSPMVNGVQASVLFMIAMTYTVIVGGGVTFFFLRRRALRTSGAFSTVRKELS
jgi:hypothetical protein